MQSASMTFDAEPHSVGPARRFAVSTVLSFRDTDLTSLDELADDVRSAVSELAANAALHAKTDYIVTVSTDGQVVRVSVSDGSPGRPRRPRHDDQDATTGRGLAMVAQLATAWGVDQRRDGAGFGGKTVWCEFDNGDRATRHSDDVDAAQRRPDASGTTGPRWSPPASRGTAVAATWSRAAA